MKLREVLPYESIEAAQHAGVSIDVAIIVPFLGDKLVLCNNRWRSWEFPGGGVEWRENVRSAAQRELVEETGADFSSLEFVNVIWLERGVYRSFKAALYYAEVDRLTTHHDYHEIEEVRIFDELPPRSQLSFECEDEIYELALQARTTVRARARS